MLLARSDCGRSHYATGRWRSTAGVIRDNDAAKPGERARAGRRAGGRGSRRTGGAAGGATTRRARMARGALGASMVRPRARRPALPFPRSRDDAFRESLAGALRHPPLALLALREELGVRDLLAVGVLEL